MRNGRNEVGQRSETVRRANLSAIVRELHEGGPLSRSELVAHTGLTRSTIRGLVGELSAAGLASELPAARLGTPGRPSPVVRLDAPGAVALGLEIAVDSLAVAVVGLGGEVFERRRLDRARGQSSVDEIVGQLAGLVEAVLVPGSPRGTLVGAGVAIVGVVRRSDGRVAQAPNLGWIDVPLGERLADRLRLAVPIAVANEADLGALAEHRRGAATGVDDVLFISGEVGVGGGALIGGRPLTGAAGYGGEVGHFPVNPTGRPCRCGSSGCWETEVGEDALLRRAGYPTAGGRAAVDEVLAEAATGSTTALDALDETGRWLGVGLAGLVNVLNPRLVVLGGLFGRIYPFIRGCLAAELHRLALPASRDLVQVVPATLGVDAPLLGAAELAFEPLLDDPAAWIRPRDLPSIVSGGTR